MIKFINTRDLLTGEQFVREPVDSLSIKIDDNDSKRIILNGGRGTGKSIILQNMENKGIETKTPTIYTHFDSVINFSVMPNKVFNECFFEHYYELCFSWKLLKFIEKNYVLTYETYFKDIELLLKGLSSELDIYIKKLRYNDISLGRYLSSTEISSEILRRLKECLGIDSFNLAIDRFDWTNGKSVFSQQVLSRYFDMFDKTIITSDDENLEDANNIKKLEEKGYAFIIANYGCNIDVVKHIIRRRIKLYNQGIKNPNNYFNADVITDEIYQNLIDKTNGNISAMVASASGVTDLWNWYGSNDVDWYQLFDAAIDEQLSTVRQLKKMSTPPKLHL